MAIVSLSLVCNTSSPPPPHRPFSLAQASVDGLAANLVHVGRHDPYPVGLQLRRESALRDPSSFFGMRVGLLQQPQLGVRCATCWNGVGDLGRNRVGPPWSEADLTRSFFYVPIRAESNMHADKAKL